MIRIFIGYDERQPVSYTALVQSIIEKTSEPVSITPLVLSTLPLKRQGLTPFTYSRFLAPHLCNYEGWALFMDVDMFVRGDLAELWALRDEQYAVMVSKSPIRFEWASLMLMNCGKCQVLTPEFVETSDGLHGLKWAPDEEIGALPDQWNHLVGYDASDPDTKIAHFTQGVPIFPETRDSEFAEEWLATAQRAVGSVPWQALMGPSVHAKPVYERLQRTAEPAAPEVQTSAA